MGHATDPFLLNTDACACVEWPSPVRDVVDGDSKCVALAPVASLLVGTGSPNLSRVHLLPP